MAVEGKDTASDKRAVPTLSQLFTAETSTFEKKVKSCNSVFLFNLDNHNLKTIISAGDSKMLDSNVFIHWQKPLREMEWKWEMLESNKAEKDKNGL